MAASAAASGADWRRLLPALAAPAAATAAAAASGSLRLPAAAAGAGAVAALGASCSPASCSCGPRPAPPAASGVTVAKPDVAAVAAAGVAATAAICAAGCCCCCCCTAGCSCCTCCGACGHSSMPVGWRGLKASSGPSSAACSAVRPKPEPRECVRSRPAGDGIGGLERDEIVKRVQVEEQKCGGRIGEQACHSGCRMWALISKARLHENALLPDVEQAPRNSWHAPTC